MIVDAVVVVKNINKNIKRIDVYSPKFQYGKPIFGLSADYEGRPVKLITGWNDIELKDPIKINGSNSQYGNELTSKVNLTRGMTIECGNDDNVYICVPEVMIK